MRMKAEDTLAVFIDFQEKLIPVIHENEAVVARAAILGKGLRELGVPIIVSQQYTKGLGETVPEVKEALGEFPPYEKKTFSCMQTASLKDAICGAGKKHILVCGTETHICVMQTVLDLLEEGFRVYVVTDAVGSRTAADKQAGIARMQAEGAYISSVESALFELTVGAESPQFKTISKLVK